MLASTLRGRLRGAWLTYLVASLADRFGATTGHVALTWTMGGTFFFIANRAAARAIARSDGNDWRAPERLFRWSWQ